MKRIALVLVAQIALGCCVAHAGVIVGAAGVSASVPSLSSYPIANLINQSGISATYVSGVTDFNTFVASTTLTVSPSTSGGWASTTNNTFPVNIDFNLGTVRNITRIALWNDTDTQGLGNFELFASADASFTTLTFLGSFAGTVQTVGSLAQVFNNTDATTQYLRVRGSPIEYNNGLLNIGEFAFEAEPAAGVPEPATLTMFGLGALGFAGAALRRRKQAV